MPKTDGILEGMAMIQRETTLGTGRNVVLSITLLLLLSILPSIYVGGQDETANRVDHPDIWTHMGPVKLHMLPDLYPYIPGDEVSSYHIVQFDTAITDDKKKMLTGLGMSVLDYIPDNAFVVKDNENNIGLLDPDTAVHIPLPSFLKISPVIWDILLHSELEKDHNALVVETFVPSGNAFLSLLSISPWVEVVSSTRYHVGLPVSSLTEIASIPDVKWVEPVAEKVILNEISTTILQVDTVRSAHGLDGTGEGVAIADTGLDTGVDVHNVTGDVHLDFDNRVIFRNFAGTSPNDEHGHGTHVAGSVGGDGTRSSGNIQGMAPNATIVFQGIALDGAQGYLSAPGNLSVMFKQAYDLGAMVHTNSWGTDGSSWWGRYTSECYDVDWTMFHYPEQLILFSAGNDGEDASPADGKIDAGSVSPPATAKSALSVGASENLRLSGGLQMTWGQGWGFPLNPVRNDYLSDNADGLAGFSSRGPTLDNRLKPDIVAPGTNILSTRSSLGASSGWGGYNGYYMYMGGTSMATPITAGTAALVRQYYNQTEGVENILGSLVKATMINGAVDMTPGQYGSSDPTTKEVNRRPDNDQGWGRLNLKESLYPGTGKMTFVNHLDGLKTGENLTRFFRVNSMEELRLTLAWSDHPGSYFAGKQLVNDLDLILTSPDGDVFHGNDLAAPFDDSRDDINPVEGITIADPQPGWWKLEVIGTNVPRGPQHFGLVASGNITEFITNSMVFDRRYYSTDDALIRLHLTGKDLIGSGTIKVNITSTSDPLGRIVTLVEEGEWGGFAGTIRTSNRTTEDQSRLHVEPDDDIYAWYSNSEYGFFYDAYSTAKKPKRVSLVYLPENHLVYSRDDLIGLRGIGEAGTDVHWTIEGSELGWMPMWDDGFPGHGDELPSDGVYTDLFYVDTEMKVKGDVMLRVDDPYLGYLYYREFPIEIDTTRPRAPQDLKAEPLPEGNSMELSWKRTGGPTLAYHSVYINRTTLNLTHDISNWKWLFNTTNGGNITEVDGLIDGVEYYFRVATVDEDGNVSSPSHWALGVPRDLTPPSISLSGNPITLAGDAVIEFMADEDLSLLEVEYYNDTDGNGTADDNKTWVPAGTSNSSVFYWNTREEAGGPGDLENMIIRARGSDEASNQGNWTEFAGWAVDNIGPLTLRFDTFPGRITNVADYENLLGTSEPLSRIELCVNDELQNSTVVGQSGLFGLPLKLSEGYNLVNLTGYDRHGAGPVVVNYEFTLDTQKPTASILDLDTIIEILPEGVTFVSSSYDTGSDPEFTGISNTTWVMVLPTGERRISYGEEVHIVFEMLGNHSIEVTVKDMAGNTDSVKMEFVVVDTMSPVLQLVGDLVVDEDTSVEYSSEGTVDNDPCAILGRCAYYNWTFTGDDGWAYYSGRWETTVVFPDPGPYLGRLFVADSSGNNASLGFEITVNDITPPDGEIRGPVRIEPGEVLNLTAVFTDNDPMFIDDGDYKWVISFLDERGVPFRWGEREGEEIGILFEDPGNYTFQVTVTDASGNSRRAEHRVWVKENIVIYDEEELTPGERSWTLIIIIAVIVLIILVLSSILVWRLKREDVKDVDWYDEDDEIEDLDDIELDEEENEFEFDEDDWYE